MARAGDVTMRATAIPSSRLNPVMARRYGVEPDDDRILLVVGLRRGDATNETSVTGRVQAQASNLLGTRQKVPLREVHNDGFIDYVGEVRVSAPDTLRFEVNVRPDGAPPTTLLFHRDFFPQ